MASKTLDLMKQRLNEVEGEMKAKQKTVEDLQKKLNEASRSEYDKQLPALDAAKEELRRVVMEQGDLARSVASQSGKTNYPLPT